MSKDKEEERADEITELIAVDLNSNTTILLSFIDPVFEAQHKISAECIGLSGLDKIISYCLIDTRGS